MIFYNLSLHHNKSTKNTTMALDHIKRISIREYLGVRGIKPTKENEQRGMYHSPLRTDNNASFSVNYIQNVFFDHGIGTGGSIIDLVSRLESCSIGEAIKRLETDHFSFHRGENISNDKRVKQIQTIKILDVVAISNQALLAYLNLRCIDIEIAKLFCLEVHYSVVNGKNYFAIGYKNDCGGYELRNKYFKGCSSKDITTILTGQKECLLFEGFMDFLSYLTIKKIQSPSEDVIVLNSLSNLPKVIQTLTTYRSVVAYLDSDEAGRKAILELKKDCKGVIDQSGYYSGLKDLNEFLCAKMKSKNENIDFNR